MAELSRTEQLINGEVIQFPIKDESEKVEKIPKRTKNGDVKKTPNNTKLNRDNIYPFKEEDIPKMVKYLKNKIDESTNVEDEMINRRNLTIFILGVNIGLRCSDLVSLKWSDIYNDDWTFRDGKKIKPKKTSKTDKHVLLKFNNDFRRAIDYYRQYCISIDINDYIFTSRKAEHVNVDRIGQIIKNAACDVGIKYNVNTHSLRKTFARLRYEHATDKSKVLVELMKVFSHANTGVTMNYICITENELEDLYNDVSIGFDAIFE